MPSTFSDLSQFLIYIFGGDIPREPLAMHQVAARGVLVYLMGIAIVRIGKSRMISRVTAVDVLLGFILGSLLSRGITGHASLSGTAASSAALAAMHFLVTWIALKNEWFESLLKGHCYLLVENGKCNERALHKSHISQSDLEEQLRQKGVGSLEEVKCAWKERSGEISVIAQPKIARPLEIAVAEGVQTVRIIVSSE